MSERLRAAAQAALEAITELDGYSRSAVTDKIARDTKQALRAALAEQENEGGLYLTIVYKDVQPGPETSTLTRHPKVSAVSWSHAIDDRNAARAALADKEVGQEPVAWRFQSAVGGWAYGSQPPVGSKYPAYPLYAAPPRREWQTLTEEEWTRLYKDWMDNETTDSYDLMNSVEAALKEKNA